jgi:hypothetical protein
MDFFKAMKMREKRVWVKLLLKYWGIKPPVMPNLFQHPTR